MINFSLLVVSAIGLLAAESLGLGNTRGREFVGPAENFTCVQNGNWPDPDRCEYYVECYLGEAGWLAFLFRCTEGELYDIEVSRCNDPLIVDCGNRPRPNGTEPIIVTTDRPETTTTTKLPGPPGEFECLGLSGYYPDPTSCQYYYQCVEGIAYHLQCPYPTVFNSEPNILRCVHRDFVPSSKDA